jgi:hypothetical protein
MHRLSGRSLLLFHGKDGDIGAIIHLCPENPTSSLPWPEFLSSSMAISGLDGGIHVGSRNSPITGKKRSKGHVGATDTISGDFADRDGG